MNALQAMNSIESSAVDLRCDVAEARAKRLPATALDKIKMRHLTSIASAACVIAAQDLDQATRAANQVLLAEVQAELAKTAERMARMSSYDRTILDGDLVGEFDEPTVKMTRPTACEGGAQ